MRSLFILLSLLFICSSTNCSQPSFFPKVIQCEKSDGQPFTDKISGAIPPNFTWTDKDSSMHRLTDYKGKPIVVMFWSKNCVSCIKDMQYIEKLYKDYAGKFEVIAVNLSDSEPVVTDIINKYKFSFLIVMDPDYRAQKCYGVAYTTIGLPWAFFIDSNGVAREKWIGEFKEKEIDTILIKLVNNAG